MRVDTHVHLFDPARFPFRADAGYTPAPHETGTVEQFLAVLDAHGISHAVIVNPIAGYLSDNRCTLDALARGGGRLKGVALLEDDVSDAEIDRLVAGGMAGIRLDLMGRGADYLRGAGARLLARMGERRLVTQIQCEGDQLAAIADVLRAASGAVIIDHAGRPDPTRGLDQPGVAALLALADRDNIIVKLSGPFRFAPRFPYAEADAHMRALVAVFGPQRCLWGSDWPFIRMDHRIDYGQTLAMLARWVPDEGAREQVLWQTPARVFGFRA
jgi:predicted TIM-barrel fold metal-dependent hydrolase